MIALSRQTIDRKPHSSGRGSIRAGSAGGGQNSPGLRYAISVTKFDNSSGYVHSWHLGDAWGSVMTDLLNVVDSTTGQVLASTGALGESKPQGYALGYLGSDFSGDVDAFKTDKLGEPNRLRHGGSPATGV